MLDQSQAEQFYRDGFLLGGRVLSDEQVDALGSELARVIEQQGRADVTQPIRIVNLAKPDAPVWQVVNIFQASQAFRSAMYTPKIVEEVAQLMDARQVRIWHDQIQYKPAGQGGVNMWHQDGPYWPDLEPKIQVTAWIALDDVDESNGCMSMVVGSHQWGDNVSFLHTFKTFEDMPSSWNGHALTVKTCPVRRGHVHYHHSLTWHGSHANTSGRPRRAIAYHYMSEATVFSNVTPIHPMHQYINVPPGQTLAGDAFPMVFDRRVLPVSETPQLAQV